MSYFRRKFKQIAEINKSGLRRFLTRLEQNPPGQLDVLAEVVDKEVWAHTDCLKCSNCCREMTPTYTFQDIKRIAAYLGVTIKQFKEKWLEKDAKSGDWMNKSRPCQFLNRVDNKCSIYEVRPADCAGFPHLTKKKMVNYIHVHKQNVQYCPATYRMVERMKELVKKNDLSEYILTAQKPVLPLPPNRPTDLLL